jgi:hypothetical protein
METIKRLTKLLLVGIGLSCGLSAVEAQVTIGLDENPNKGALLDLKERSVTTDAANADKGLMLPRVELENKDKLYPMLASGYDSAEDKKHAGLVVYNTTDDADFDRGLYLWDGEQWLPMNSSSAGGSPFTLDVRNGLTYTNDIIKLGGPLTEATTLTTTAANTLNINGPGLTIISTPTTIGGDLTISGGVPGAGKVLTSDAAGQAAWAAENKPSGGTIFTRQLSYSPNSISVNFTVPANQLTKVVIRYFYDYNTAGNSSNFSVNATGSSSRFWIRYWGRTGDISTMFTPPVETDRYEEFVGIINTQGGASRSWSIGRDRGPFQCLVMVIPLENR